MRAGHSSVVRKENDFTQLVTQRIITAAGLRP